MQGRPLARFAAIFCGLGLAGGNVSFLAALGAVDCETSQGASPRSAMKGVPLAFMTTEFRVICARWTGVSFFSAFFTLDRNPAPHIGKNYHIRPYRMLGGMTGGAQNLNIGWISASLGILGMRNLMVTMQMAGSTASFAFSNFFYARFRDLNDFIRSRGGASLPIMMIFPLGRSHHLSACAGTVFHFSTPSEAPIECFSALPAYSANHSKRPSFLRLFRALARAAMSVISDMGVRTNKILSASLAGEFGASSFCVQSLEHVDVR